MIRINLLPHREMRRERRKKEFVAVIAAVAIAGVTAAFAGGVVINRQIAQQQARNAFIQAENVRLDAQILEISTLREEIASLRARQAAVENLQSDRTVPVQLMHELVRQTPEGIYLRGLRQEDMKVVLSGHAQSNESIAELLRNLAERSAWMERPELVEIKAVSAAAPGDKQSRRIFEFSLNALIKRPSRSDDPKPRAPVRTAAADGAAAAAR